MLSGLADSPWQFGAKWSIPDEWGFLPLLLFSQCLLNSDVQEKDAWIDAQGEEALWSSEPDREVEETDHLTTRTCFSISRICGQSSNQTQGGCVLRRAAISDKNQRERNVDIFLQSRVRPAWERLLGKCRGAQTLFPFRPPVVLVKTTWNLNVSQLQHKPTKLFLHNSLIFSQRTSNTMSSLPPSDKIYFACCSIIATLRSLCTITVKGVW